MKVQLTENEKERLISLMSRFSELNDRMDACESALEKLESERKKLNTEAKSLSEEIETIRKEESKFTLDLIDKYGEFKINIKTLEIESII